MSALTLELSLGVLMLIVFVASLLARGTDRRWIAWIATLGIVALGVLSALVKPTPPTLFGMFAQDALAIFAKRLFLAATFIGLLAGIAQATCIWSFWYGKLALVDMTLSLLVAVAILAGAFDRLRLPARAPYWHTSAPVQT